MQVKTNTVTKVELTLTLAEVKWLRAQMQNPLFAQTPDEEEPLDRDMRHTFFNTLADIEA